MEFLRQNAIRQAKREVAQWFATTGTGAALLDGKGGVFQLSVAEAHQLREEAEAEVTQLYLRVMYRAFAAAGSLVAIQIFASMLPSLLEAALRGSATIIYSAHGAWLFYEAWKAAQEQKLYRAGLARRLGTRAPLPEHLAGDLALSDPVRKVLIGVFILLFGANFAAEPVAHGGIDVFQVIPPWVWLPLMIFILVLAVGNLWIDRSRGIGVLPPDDLTARVRNRSRGE